MKISREIYIGLVFLLMLSACSNPTNIPTQTQITTIEQTAQYPAPQVEATYDSSYPAPATPVINTPAPTFTSDPKMGNVVGKIIVNGNAVKYTTLYLAEVIKDESGKDVVAGLDRVKSPNASTDDQGSFAFINIKTGSYALILDVVTNQYMMKYPGNNETIIIQVEAGKEIKLGDLDYDSLPIP